jgi:hypothetical protein
LSTDGEDHTAEDEEGAQAKDNNEEDHGHDQVTV